MTRRLLFVDDDPGVLSAIERRLRAGYDLETAASGHEGLRILAERGPFAVVVADMRMPGMDGVQFLSQVRETAPDTVRLMMTAFADVDTAMQAVNRGEVFRFLAKDHMAEALGPAIDAALEQHRLVAAERELLERTLCGSVKVLTDVLAMVNPTAFGRAERIQRVVVQLAGELGVEEPWQVEVAALLSQVGCVVVPEEAVARWSRGERLSPPERRMFHRVPEVGQNLLAQIPRMDEVARIIAYQNQRFDGSGDRRDDVVGEEIPLGARMLKLAIDFDTALSADRTHEEALAALEETAGWYDGGCLDALRRILDRERPGAQARMELPVFHLEEGMTLAEDVITADDRLLVTAGVELTAALLERLDNWERLVGVRQPVVVLVDGGESNGRDGGAHRPPDSSAEEGNGPAAAASAPAV